VTIAMREAGVGYRLLRYGGVAVLVLSAGIFTVFRFLGRIPPVAALGLSLLFFLVTFGYLICQMVFHLGSMNAALFIGIAVVVSGGSELLGTRTGWIFGDYSYTPIMGPQVFGSLPVLIPLVWLVIGYCALEAAHWLLGSRVGVVGLSGRLAAGALAAWLMTAWDLVMDPVVITYGGWVWHEGGAWFGIPVSNYVGWLATGLAIQLLFALVRRPTASALPPRSVAAVIPVFGYFFALTVNSFGALRLGLHGPAMIGLFSVSLLLLLGFGRR
jgi:putative membrane protein